MRITIFLLLLALTLSCDSLSSDFFEILLNTNHPELTRVCAHNPSIFLDGRFVEQYEMSSETEANFLARFSVCQGDSLDFPVAGALYFERYHSQLTWRKTPVKSEDSIIMQVADEVGDELLECYRIEDVIRLLQTNGNYYALVYETSGKVLVQYKFYLLEPATHGLYVLTSR
jgi:hypothetical protein